MDLWVHGKHIHTRLIARTNINRNQQWEDPEVDMQHLNLTKDDSLFVITSAGDSMSRFSLVWWRISLTYWFGFVDALHYAISARPRRIHCVDMNPCQVCRSSAFFSWGAFPDVQCRATFSS